MILIVLNPFLAQKTLKLLVFSNFEFAPKNIKNFEAEELKNQQKTTSFHYFLKCEIKFKCSRFPSFEIINFIPSRVFYYSNKTCTSKEIHFNCTFLNEKFNFLGTFLQLNSWKNLKTIKKPQSFEINFLLKYLFFLIKILKNYSLFSK